MSDVRPQTAIHEAAHAVVAKALGTDVYVCRAVPYDSRLTGRVAGVTLLDASARRLSLEDNAAVDVAGAMAEMACGLEPAGCETDLQRVLDAIPPDQDAEVWARAVVRRTAEIICDNVKPLCQLVSSLIEDEVLSGDKLAEALQSVRPAKAPAAVCRCPQPVGPRGCRCGVDGGRVGSLGGRT